MHWRMDETVQIRGFVDDKQKIVFVSIQQEPEPLTPIHLTDEAMAYAFIYCSSMWYMRSQTE